MRRSIVDELFALFAERGQAAYFGEQVSELEHALQTAWFAERAKADAKLVAAALLHDVGHLLHGHGEDVAKRGIDAQHEELGAEWLLEHFGEDVAEPVRLHVPAKRYLCAVDPDYMQGLSPASALSLRLQGGPFTPSETADYLKSPHALRAADLRRWDDAGKVPNLEVPGLEHYRRCLENALQS